MSKKRSKKYDKPLTLKDNVEFTDLINVSLQQPIKKVEPKAKRAKVKKK